MFFWLLLLLFQAISSQPDLAISLFRVIPFEALSTFCIFEFYIYVEYGKVLECAVFLGDNFLLFFYRFAFAHLWLLLKLNK